MNAQTMRILTFVVGALGAVYEALNLALDADAQVAPAHLVALASVALITFTMKWPGDVTKTRAKEREREVEARVKRESILPPLDGDQ